MGWDGLDWGIVDVGIGFIGQDWVGEDFFQEGFYVETCDLVGYAFTVDVIMCFLVVWSVYNQINVFGHSFTQYLWIFF